MIVFWIAAALLSAAAAALIVHFAARAPQGPTADPAAAVYKRQLSEIDDLANRGLLGEDERAAAHAEAGRRLLSTTEVAAETGGTKGTQIAVLSVAVAVGLGAAGVYAVLGQPGKPDEPFARRAEPWIAAVEALSKGQSQDFNLSPEQVIVGLKALVAKDPGNPGALAALGDTQAKVGQVQLGIHNLRRAAELRPDDPQVWAGLGAALVAATGEDETVTPEAEQAFEKAVALNPKDFLSRYRLGQAKLARKDVAGGIADWRLISDGLPPGDEGRGVINEQIARAEKAGGLPGPEPKPTDNPANQEMIQQMVASLAAKLKENPDDLDGWKKLIRSYAVLGDKTKMNAALDQARRIFKDKPGARAALEAAAEKPQ